jgi:hypothetical protein
MKWHAGTAGIPRRGRGIGFRDSRRVRVGLAPRRRQVVREGGRRGVPPRSQAPAWERIGREAPPRSSLPKPMPALWYHRRHLTANSRSRRPIHACQCRCEQSITADYRANRLAWIRQLWSRARRSLAAVRYQAEPGNEGIAKTRVAVRKPGGSPAAPPTGCILNAMP